MAKVFGDFDVILHPGIAREEFVTFVQRTTPMHEPWPGIRAMSLAVIGVMVKDGCTI